MTILANNKVAVGQFVRDNGWDKPWNKYQVTTWIVLIAFSLICFGVEIVALHPNAWAAAFSVLGSLFVVDVILIVVTTSIDPSDDNSLEHRKSTKKSVPVFDRNKHKHVIEGGYCHICECNVLDSSKHCQPCNKCVKGFDHHCMWLNNCVGVKNYRLFLALLATTLMGFVGMLVVGVLVFVSGFVADNLLYKEVWWMRLPGGFVVFQTIIGIKIILVLISIGLIAQLGFFHVMLIYRNQTTYSHFKMQEEKRAQKSKVPSETERSRNFDGMPVPACSERHSESAVESVVIPMETSLKEDLNTFSNINHSYTVEIV